MATFSSRQWVAIFVSVLLFIGFFFINRKPPASAAEKPPVASGHATQQPAMDFNQLLDEARKQAPADQAAIIGKMESELADASGDARLPILKSLISLYDSVGDVIPATYYAEKMAEIRNSADLWYKAADRYYTAAEIGDQQARMTLIQKASQCYTNSFKIDSTNLDTKVGIGKCLVEMSDAPMQGIGIINDVIKQDSNNLNAQLTLGELSVQSGQLPKAIYRFNRVLQIKPTYSDAYLFLADVYEKEGNKEQEVKCLEKYSTFVTDKKIQEEIHRQIQKIQNDTLTNK